MPDVPPIGTQASRRAAQAPDAPAITCAGRTITRRELDESTNRLARAYAELGVRQGDYVTIVLPNSIEFLQAAIAAWKLGAVPQPLPTSLPDAEFEAILALRPRALLVGRDNPHGEIPSVPADFTPDPALSDAALPEMVSPVWKAMASGGSTGRPKLIESGGDSRYDTAAFGAGLGVQEGDTTLVSEPMSHNTGMIGATVGMLLGHLVVMPRFDPHEFLRLITEHKVNFLATVPTIMHRTLPVYHANPDAYDLSSIKRFWHVGAPCPPTVKEAWIELLGPDRLWEFYGGTELQAFTIISGREWLDHPGSVGRVVFGEIKIFEIEGALSAHPKVLSCLVVGVPDEDLGQVPYALVQADGLDEADVIDFLKDRVAPYKVPRTVEFVDTPLRDEAGKARRTKVRDEVIARLAQARP
ncbi:AMP-binding protein [Mycobacterium hubeiense]|uniref:AMP-binding protein n=1 Tax=Mycobacterium hubeiense TaxID=1867256 RepID=UPI000C7E923D|nr:AMP-binding protein [Mycobacterium sp. QGD 101]